MFFQNIKIPTELSRFVRVLGYLFRWERNSGHSVPLLMSSLFSLLLFLDESAQFKERAAHISEMHRMWSALMIRTTYSNAAQL